MTPRQSDVPVKVVGGLFVVASIVPLMLLARGYHTGVLVFIGLMFGIGAITFFYDRSHTLWGLAISAAIGILSLMVQGYHTLVLAIIATIFGIGALTFIYYEGQHLWSSWFPDQPFNPTIKRWLRYLLMIFTGAVAYVHVRAYINFLTGVDPGNFPTALAALTVLNTLVWWLLVLPSIMLVMAGVYAGAAYIANLSGRFDLGQIGGISVGRWKFRVFGAISVGVISFVLVATLVGSPWPQQAGRLIVTTVLIVTEFSYDRTCAVSSERRLVAQLKDRKERQVSMVSIAEERSVVWFIFFPLFDFTFSTGTCADQI